LLDYSRLIDLDLILDPHMILEMAVKDTYSVVILMF